ncbi:MAG TPA: ABC transporter substrate-binding protein [Candidatus Krumholzibacteria bacterium]|nr:ABC transporter substrate-binding protein [Candidatus Krumholzibacteria bacterium]
MLELALETAPNRLDPAFAVDVSEGEICALVFEGLVGFSPEGILSPALARSWETSDGRRFVFHIDSRARFADGRPVRAADVRASFERVLAPATASPRTWVLERIRGARDFRDGKSTSVAGLETPDDSTVVVELEEPFAPFLSMLALPAARVVDTSSTSADGIPMGSGPWVVSEWVRGDRITLVPNPHHARRATGIEGVRYRIIPEPFTRIAEFETGAIDVLEIPDAEVSRFLNDPKRASRLLRRPELRVFYIGINNPRFPDPRMRRALNHAVNVPELSRVLQAGAAIPAHGAIPPGIPGFEARPGYEYDPVLAKQLLQEAGATNVKLEVWLRESAEGGRVMEAVQGYWRAVGVEATLVRREWSAFKQAVSAGKVDAFLLDWFADYPDAENFLFPLFHSSNHGGGGNRSFFSDPRVDRMIEDASRELDLARRARSCAQIDSLVHSQAPWVYLYFPTTFHIVAERVEGYRLPSLYLGNDFSGVRVAH